MLNITDTKNVSKCAVVCSFRTLYRQCNFQKTLRECTSSVTYLTFVLLMLCRHLWEYRDKWINTV